MFLNICPRVKLISNLLFKRNRSSSNIQKTKVVFQIRVYLNFKYKHKVSNIYRYGQTNLKFVYFKNGGRLPTEQKIEVVFQIKGYLKKSQHGKSVNKISTRSNLLMYNIDITINRQNFPELGTAQPNLFRLFIIRTLIMIIMKLIFPIYT